MINAELLLQNFTDGVFLLDSQGYILYSNSAATQMFGYSEAEFRNRPVSLIYPNEDDIVKMEYELGVTAKNNKFVTEAWKIDRNGQKIWCEITLSRLDDKIPSQFLLIARNVEQRKNVELELRRSEERYRLMVEGVKDYAIFMLDADGYIRTWNEGGRRNNGYSSYEIIGKHFSIFYTADDLEDKKPERELKIARETGKYEEEGWRVKKNGSLFWANVVITALYNETNQLIGYSKVTRDLSEKREAEEVLRQSEERYRSLVEQVTDYGIFMLDDKGRIVSWNEGARRIQGYSNEEIIGKYFSIFYPEEDILNGKPAMELKQAREVGKYEEEGWRIRKTGGRFWANVVITAVYNEDNILIGYSKVTRDLTERKESERALRESYESYRTLADQLQITNTELSAANKELEQFTSIVSHDLQEPLRTIKSFLKLLEQKISKKDFTDLDTYIGKSVRAADRMRSLIQSLLEYSQLDKAAPANEEVNTCDMINEALHALDHQVTKTGASIDVNCACDTVIGDKVQLQQVIQNLVSNALKFTDGKAPVIKIECAEDELFYKFAISDNGIGISPEDKTKVFEIFRRLHTKKEYPGTGIGLAICKKIVDKHGGSIWLDSLPGKGTIFYFTLRKHLQATHP